MKLERAFPMGLSLMDLQLRDEARHQRTRNKNINVVIATHCHNDLGLATANTLAGAYAGARQPEVTINGIGERAGNTSLKEVVMAIRCRGGELMKGIHTGINAKHIVMISKMVEEYTGMNIQLQKAIVGANAFSHESGICQDGMLKFRGTYKIISPEDVGFSRTNGSGVVLGKLRQIRVFELIECHVDYDDDVDWISYFPETGTNCLESLVFDCIEFTINFKALESLVMCSPSLKKIWLNELVNLMVDDIAEAQDLDLDLSPAFNSLKHLTCLSGFKGMLTSFLPSIQPVCANLASLNFSYAHINAEQLMPIISRCHKLQIFWVLDSLNRQLSTPKDKGPLFAHLLQLSTSLMYPTPMCTYSIEYEDTSMTNGYYVSNTFYFESIMNGSPTKYSSKSVGFGCSIISQLSSRVVPKVFSHCLRRENGGILVLGEIVNLDMTFCKSIANEFAAKMDLEFPTYKTIQIEGLLPSFVSTVVFDGTESRATVSQIINAKKKLYATYKARESNSSLAGPSSGTIPETNRVTQPLKKPKLEQPYEPTVGSTGNVASFMNLPPYADLGLASNQGTTTTLDSSYERRSYNLNLQSITIDFASGITVDIDRREFAPGETLIDSGTTLSILAEKAYYPFINFGRRHISCGQF